MYKVQAQKTETWEERQSSLREERKAAQFIKRWCKWSVWRFFYLSVSFLNVYVPCRVSVRDQGEHVVNVLHVLGQRIVDSVTSARYCVTKQNLLQDEASPWESFIWIQWNILALYLLLVCSKVWEKKKLVFKENWVSSCMTERLNGLLTDWLTEWLNDWMTERLTDWLNDWLTDWLNG